MHYFWVELGFLIVIPILWALAMVEGWKLIGKMRWHSLVGYRQARAAVWAVMVLATALAVFVVYSILKTWAN